LQHALPPNTNFLTSLLVLYINFQLLENKGKQGRIQSLSLGGAIPVIFGSQVSPGSQVSFRIVKNHGEKS